MKYPLLKVTWVPAGSFSLDFILVVRGFALRFGRILLLCNGSLTPDSTSEATTSQLPPIQHCLCQGCCQRFGCTLIGDAANLHLWNDIYDRHIQLVYWYIWGNMTQLLYGNDVLPRSCHTYQTVDCKRTHIAPEDLLHFIHQNRLGKGGR